VVPRRGRGARARTTRQVPASVRARRADRISAAPRRRSTCRTGAIPRSIRPPLAGAQGLYSVPTRYRQDARRARRPLVGALVSRHGADQGASAQAGGRGSTDPKIFRRGKAPWGVARCGRRRPQRTEQGARTSELRRATARRAVPWIKLRQAYGPLRLCQRYGRMRHALCAPRAFGRIECRRSRGHTQDARRTEDAAVAIGRLGDPAVPRASPLTAAGLATRAATDGGPADVQDGVVTDERAESISPDLITRAQAPGLVRLAADTGRAPSSPSLRRRTRRYGGSPLMLPRRRDLAAGSTASIPAARRGRLDPDMVLERWDSPRR